MQALLLYGSICNPPAPDVTVRSCEVHWVRVFSTYPLPSLASLSFFSVLWNWMTAGIEVFSLYW